MSLREGNREPLSGSQPCEEAGVPRLAVDGEQIQVVVESSEHRTHLVSGEVAARRRHQAWTSFHELAEGVPLQPQSDSRHLSYRVAALYHVRSPSLYCLLELREVLRNPVKSVVLRAASNYVYVSPLGVKRRRLRSLGSMRRRIGFDHLGLFACLLYIFRSGANSVALLRKDVRNRPASVELLGAAVEEVFHEVKKKAILLGFDSGILDDEAAIGRESFGDSVTVLGGVGRAREETREVYDGDVQGRTEKVSEPLQLQHAHYKLSMQQALSMQQTNRCDLWSYLITANEFSFTYQDFGCLMEWQRHCAELHPFLPPIYRAPAHLSGTKLTREQGITRKVPKRLNQRAMHRFAWQRQKRRRAIYYILNRMMQQDEGQIQLQVQCRQGPIRERACTDWFCCLLYVLLLGAVVSLALLANSADHLSEAQVEKLLKTKAQDMPYLSTEQVIPDILIGLGLATALCVLMVVTTYMLPQVSAYLYIPLCLLLMLVLGAGFLYRFFGNKLPFLDPEIQQSYINKFSILTLVCGLGCLLGFLVSLVVILSKQQRIKFIVACLKLAKLCFWDNWYVFGVSVVLSGVTMAAYYGNIQFIRFAMVQKDGHELVPRYNLVQLILFEALWTHGFLKSYSDFLFQSISLHWYYSASSHQLQLRKQGHFSRHQQHFSRQQQHSREEDYSGIRANLLPSVALSVRHIGTIVFGSLLAFFPDFVNSMVNSCEEKVPSCYKYFCCCHKALFEGLSKYSHLGTIMYGHPFCRATRSIRRMRVTAKHSFPQLYMIGNFYMTLMKIFVILLSLLLCYVLIIFSNNFTGNLNLIGPIIVTLLSSDEIANHFINTTGLVGDSIYFAYVMDFNCQTSNFGNLNAAHCPQDAYQIINEAKISRYDIYD